MKLKNVGAIVLAASLVTVGGVYATWSYAQNNVEAVTETITLGVAEKSLDTKKGTFTLTHYTTEHTDAQGVKSTNTLTAVDGSDAKAYNVLIEPKNYLDKTTEATAADRYQAILDYATIEVTYTASNDASAEMIANGIDAKVTIAFEYDSSITYDNTDIFTTAVAETIVEIKAKGTNNGYNEWSGDNGVFTYQISVSDFVVLNDIKLNTLENYTSFAEAFAQTGAKITVKIEDTATPSDNG